MLQLTQRKNSRIFILVLAAVIAFSTVSECAYPEEELLSNNEEETARIEDEDQDADVFVAEIFPVGVGNFEQIFHPLARYKKAVLDVDAEIEPMSNSQMQDRNQLQLDRFVVDPTTTQSKTISERPGDSEFITVSSFKSPASRNIYNGQLAEKISKVKLQDSSDKFASKNYTNLNSNTLVSSQKYQQQSGNLVEESKEVPMQYFNTTDEDDLVTDSSGSGAMEGSGTHHIENFHSPGSIKRNKSQNLQYENLISLRHNDNGQDFKFDETLNSVGQVSTGQYLSNDQRNYNLLQKSVAHSSKEDDGVRNNVIGRKENTEEKSWQNFSPSERPLHNTKSSRELSGHDKNARNMSQYEASDMRVTHELENKALLTRINGGFKQPGGVNGQPVSTDKGSGEYMDDNTYTSEGSGSRISIDDEESGREPIYNQGSVLLLRDRDHQVLHYEMFRNGGSNKTITNGGGNELRAGNLSNVAGDNTACIDGESKCSFSEFHVNRNDMIQKSIGLLQSNEPIAKKINATNMTTAASSFKDDLANKEQTIKIIHDSFYNGNEQSQKESTNNIAVNNSSNDTENGTVFRQPIMKNMIKEENRRNDTMQVINGKGSDVKTNSTSTAGNFENQDEAFLSNEDAWTDTTTNLTENTTLFGENEDEAVESKAIENPRQMGKAHMPSSSEIATTAARLSRGEAVRQLFLSSLSREGGEDNQNKEETPMENRTERVDTNQGAQIQRLKGGTVMSNQVNADFNFQLANKGMPLANENRNDWSAEIHKSSLPTKNKKDKNAAKVKQGIADIRQRNPHKESKHKSFHNRKRFKNDQRPRHGKGKFKSAKGSNTKNVNFITTMMSLKARELYKNLIHDTSKALMSRRHHQQRGHHFTRIEIGPFEKDQEERNKLKGTNKHHVHFLTHKKSSLKPEAAENTRFHEMKKLTTSLLNTMTRNSHQLVQQTQVLPIKASEKVNIKDSMPEKLDSPHSLIEKLAELRYANIDRMNEKEVPIPEAENAEDTSSSGRELENENPGKTVLQRQSKIGLGTEVNMDSLDGKKQGYEFKSMDAKIEGELAESQLINENNKESSIGKIDSNRFMKDDRKITESAMGASPIPSALSVYNSEEILESEPQRFGFGNNESMQEGMHSENELGEQMVNQALLQHGNESMQYEEKKLTHRTQSKYFGKQMKKKSWQRNPTMYFSGNSSLWKHHPYVSMDIMPLVDVFYKVNHKNLLDIVKEDGEKTGKKINNNAFQKKKQSKKKIAAGKAVQKHKSIRRRKVKKGRHELKKTSSYMQKIYKNKKGTAKFSLKNGEPIDDLINHVHKAGKKLEDHKTRSKQKYKHKNKKHVKGIAKFGISEVKQSPNPPEIPEIKNNMPNGVKYYKIENAAKYGAVCIDGSIPGYYLREGKKSDANKWIIHLHGGAWCYDPETCFRRSFSILGSSNNWSAENITNFFQGILSTNKEVNPWFSDWNVVVQSYCDGGLFSGRRKEPLLYRGRKLYFRGRQILKAMVASLKGRNLQKASDIILSGTSAGGLAVLLQGDYLRHKLPSTALVRGLVDAGFFLNSQAEDGSNIIGNQFRGLYNLHNPRLRKACERGRDNSTRFLCLFPENTIQTTKLPIYFVNALYDHWQISELQRVHCVYHNDQCMTSERDRILNFRKLMFSKLNDAIAHLPGAGLFADSCIGHGQVIVDYTWSRIRVNNSTLQDAFNNWMRDRRGDKKHLNIDCHFPCNGSCPRAMVGSCIKNFKGASSSHRTRRNVELC